MYEQSVCLAAMLSTVAVLCESGSLVPRPPLFIPSVCVHNNTREHAGNW